MIIIPLRSSPLRWALLLVLLLALSGLSWVITRAALGESLANYAQAEPNLSVAARRTSADSAIAFAPQDATTHWARSLSYLAAATEEQDASLSKMALADLQTATRLSPNDARLWLAQGKVHDQLGNADSARQALIRATQLAPNHFDAHWALGNFLLRAGEREAAFASLQTALRKRPAALPLVFDYAWNFYNGDAQAVIQALAPSQPLRAAFVAQLITHNQIDAALVLWKQGNSQYSAAEIKRVVDALTYIGRHRAAYEMWQAAGDTPQPDTNSLLANGSFEQNFDPSNSLPFYAWQMRPPTGISIALDNQLRTEGTLSLRTRFEIKENISLFFAQQTVPLRTPATSIATGKRYQLSFQVKTDQLQSLSTPQVAVFDAADDRRFNVSSVPIENGTNDWREYTLSFTPPAATEAITLRLQRMPCGEAPCPIYGRIWFDEFKLTESTAKAGELTKSKLSEKEQGKRQ